MLCIVQGLPPSGITVFSEVLCIVQGLPQSGITVFSEVLCIVQGLPPSGITVFASQLHAHLTGKRLVTRHVRYGVELPELNKDDHYSPHYQEIRRLQYPTTVLPVSQ